MANIDVMRAEVAEKTDPRLLFLWHSAEVAVDIQYALVSSGCTSLSAFKNLAADRADLRRCLTSDLGLQVDTLEKRVKLGNVITAYETANINIEREAVATAEHRIAGLTRPIASADYNVIIAAVETTVGKLELRHRPSKAYVAMKLDQVEDRELLAETLDEVTSREGEEGQGLEESIDSKGQRRVVRKIKKALLPTDSEDLRERHKLMNIALLCVKCRHAIPLSANIGDTPYDSLTNYLLGDKVLRFRAEGSLVPHWSLILNYEFAIRRKMCDLLRGDSTLGLVDALKKGVADTELREQYFITPFLAMAAGAPRSWAPATPGTVVSTLQQGSFPPLPPAPPPPSSGGRRYQPYWGWKGQSKGKSHWAGRPQARIPEGKPVGKTPDGKEICFNYNNADKNCTHGRCNRLHVCRLQGCFEKHPMYECKKFKKSGG